MGWLAAQGAIMAIGLFIGLGFQCTSTRNYYLKRVISRNPNPAKRIDIG